MLIDKKKLALSMLSNLNECRNHWHGAVPDSWFSHVAFEISGTGLSNEWLEPVTNEEYSKLA